MGNFQSDRFRFLATEEASPTRLAQGHSRRLGFDPTFRYSSTFLRPLAPSPLRDFLATYGRSDSCQLNQQHEHRLCSPTGLPDSRV
jgi:hypothetical protein